MKYYAIGNLDFISNEWVAEYLQKVTLMVERVGGRYLARSPSVEVIEGEGVAPQSVVLIEFPSKEAAEQFYYSDEYEPFKKSRQSGSRGQFLLVAGQDIANMQDCAIGFHALDLEGLRVPEITFWTVYSDCELVACGALKEIDPFHGEVKSMRVRMSARGNGVGSKLVNHIIEEAKNRRYSALKLETGSMAFFEPARNLYLKHGFTYCGPFGSYKEDPNSVFMVLHLNA